MRTIDLIGGMSRESAATHYRVLDELARERLGGPHSAKLPTYSFDFAEIEALRAGGDWGGAGEAITTKLCRGVVDDASRRAWVEIVRGEVEGGADGVILGRTPRGGLLLAPEDVPVPTFDTTLLHARAAIDFALGRARARRGRYSIPSSLIFLVSVFRPQPSSRAAS